MSKYCQHCGAEVQDNSVFCEYCGKNLSDAVVEKTEPQRGEKRCKTCGNIFSEYLRECPNCGANSVQLIPAKLIKCKNCNQDMAENVIKCPHCGKRTKIFYLVAFAIATVVICFSIILVLLLTFDSPKQQTNNNTEQQNNILYGDDNFSLVHTTSKITVTK